ncbi:MAG: site-2 protease family protein [Phycisphaerales bacterium JB063]
MGDGFFIQKLFSSDPGERFFFLAAILTVVVSIVLHELAHGWMAIKLGDNTPNRLGRMTGNPLVHMGPFSIVALLLLGIAWGQMPIDPSRMRGKYAEAKVAFAGPATNLSLAFLSLTSLGLWVRFGGGPSYEEITQLSTIAGKGYMLLWVFGQMNLMLFVFNLLPVPPLDGSHILANFHQGYANLLGDPSKQGIFLFAFMFAFMFAGALFGPVLELGGKYVLLVSG